MASLFHQEVSAASTQHQFKLGSQELSSVGEKNANYMQIQNYLILKECI